LPPIFRVFGFATRENKYRYMIDTHRVLPYTPSQPITREDLNG
jgi:hypothetical protein